MSRSRIAVDTPEELTLEKLIPIVDNYTHIQASKTPLCIIKYGPPGSGKTTADALVQKMFDLDLDQFAKIDKDVPLTSIASFRKGSLEIIKKYPGLRYKYQAAQKKVVDFQERILKTKDVDGFSITDKIPIVLQRAFDYNLNILWETTGQSIASQELIEQVFASIPKIYRIVVLFPIISLQTARERVSRRADNHLLKDPPYYRPVPYRQLKNATEKSRKYFTEKIVPRVLSGEIYQLFCFNNTTQPKLSNYQAVKNSNVRQTRKRLAKGWRFGLNTRGRRKITQNARRAQKTF